jgi:carbamoyltransferase
MRTLGINALFHDPAAALVVDGRTVAAAEEERFSRRKHGKRPLPSPYVLFVHDVTHEWRDRLPAVVHVDGTARIQTVEDGPEPLVARMLRGFERRTGLPVVVDTGLNTAGRPKVDDPRDALECFGSAPVDPPAIGPYAVRRGRALG